MVFNSLILPELLPCNDVLLNRIRVIFDLYAMSEVVILYQLTHFNQTSYKYLLLYELSQIMLSILNSLSKFYQLMLTIYKY